MRCPVRGCGEPWDYDTLHDIVDEQNPTRPWIINGKHDQKVYEEKFFYPLYRKFNQIGCAAFDARHNTNADEVNRDGIPASMAQSALYELMGDDVDGIEAMLEDEGF